MGLEDSPKSENANTPSIPCYPSVIQMESGTSGTPQLFDPLESFREPSQIIDLHRVSPFQSMMSAPNDQYSNENVQILEEDDTPQNPPPQYREPESVLNEASVRWPSTRTNITNDATNNRCHEIRRLLAAAPVQAHQFSAMTSSGTSQPQHIGLPICQAPKFQKVVLHHHHHHHQQRQQQQQRPHLPQDLRSLSAPNGQGQVMAGGNVRPRVPPPPPQLHSQQNPMMLEPSNCNSTMPGFVPFVPQAVGFDPVASHIQALERKVGELSARLNDCNRERLHFQHQIHNLGAQTTLSERQTQEMAAQKNEEISRLREQLRNVDARRSVWKQKCRQTEVKVQSQQVQIDSLAEREKQLQDEVTKLSQQCGEYMYLKYLLQMKNQEFQGMMLQNKKIGGELQKKSELLKKYHENASIQFRNFMMMARDAYVNGHKRILSQEVETENPPADFRVPGPATKRERLDQLVNRPEDTARDDVNVEPMNLILNQGHNHSETSTAVTNEREQIVSNLLLQNQRDNGGVSDAGLGLLAQVAGMAQPAAAVPDNNNGMVIIDNNNIHYDNEVVINDLAWNGQNGDMNSQEFGGGNDQETDYE